MPAPRLPSSLLVATLIAACGDSTAGSASDTDETTASTGASTEVTSSSSTSTGPATTGTADPSSASASSAGTMTGTSTGDASDTATTTTSSPSSSDTGSTGDDTTTTTTGPLEITDFYGPGPFDVDVEAGSEKLDGECTMKYTLYSPTDAADAPLAIVVHGFSQNQSNMAQMGEHIASHGVRALTPDLCHATFIDTDHPQNGIDLTLLAEAVAPGEEIIYVGYSAGGLATFLAAASDPDTRALLGLDPVDAMNLGAMAAPGIDAPTLALHGSAGSCNNNGDSFGLAKLVPGAWALNTVGASHCDFQGDEGFACGICGPNHPELRTLIVALSTAFVAWQADVDPTGEAWVTIGGEKYLELVAEGLLKPL